MKLPQRIDLLGRLGTYILSDEPDWNNAKEMASRKNGWFIPEFINEALKNIAQQYLNTEHLQNLASQYSLGEPVKQKNVGIVMAGNIPLVGLHDLMAVFIAGHKAIIKLSSKDEDLMKTMVEKMIQWDSRVSGMIEFREMLKGCDAYIATGGNNTSRYFDYYFGKYPHITRRNRTSVAILTGEESDDDLKKLADDVYLFFGLGCRNVTKIYTPKGYDFIPLLKAFDKYQYLADHNKYHNNYDYHLALLIMNNRFYMTNGSILLVEDAQLFSPISQLNYEYYSDLDKVKQELSNNENIQCVVGPGGLAFGTAQCPRINEFADGVDTLRFLRTL